MENNMNDYWTQAAENYGRIIDDELNSFRPSAWKSLILGGEGLSESLEILDVGTGPGFFSIILSQEGHQVTGIDCSDGMIEIARRNMKRHGVWPIISKMDCQQMNFKANRFDLIISRNLTWTLKKPDEVYEKWLEILKPGGKLMIFDANWHHHYFDEKLMQEVKYREARCIDIYGSTFSGADNPEEKINIELLPLSKELRPDWDVQMLMNCGFREVDYQRDITELVWDDKERLLYGASPMFMISAVK